MVAGVPARLAGAAVLAAWLAHAWTRAQHGRLPEMLWGCHVATLAIAFGLLRGAPAPVAIGLVFHLGVGAPAWAVDALVRGSVAATSLLAHVVPPLAAALALRGTRWPRHAAARAWLGYLTAIAAARLATPAALNVNLAHAPWGPAAAAWPTLGEFTAAHAAATLAALLIADAALRRGYG